MNPRDTGHLIERVHVLERKVAELERALHGDFYQVHKDAFKASTGFRDAAQAVKEFEESKCSEALQNIDRGEGPGVFDLLPTAAETFKQVHQDIDPELIDFVLGEQMKKQRRKEKKDTRGVKPKVNEAHVFLLPFLYIFGGLLEWAGHFLPGFHIGQAQMSVLLQHSINVVGQLWAPRYYTVRSLDWLRKFCPRTKDDEADVDCVLYLDGTKMRQDRDGGVRGQRAGFSGVAKDHIGQIIGVTNANCWLIEVSLVAGGQTTECDLVWKLRLFERINKQAMDRREHFHLRLILDRGFRELKKRIDSEQADKTWPFSNLKVSCMIVEHLGTAEEPDRSQHAQHESEFNRGIQARRWVNEKAFAFLKQAHFFDRPLDASVLYHINGIVTIAVALANMRLGCPVSNDDV